MRVTNFGLAATVLVCALILGGGSFQFPAQRAVVELVGAGVLGILMWRGWRGPTDRWTVALMALVIAVLLLGLAQLAPLPAAVWQSLPNRALPSDIATATGAGNAAMPLSLTPDATVRALLCLIAPIAMLAATLACTASERRRLFGWAIGLAIFSAVLGLLQAVSGPAGPYIYATAHDGTAVGVFANHNHHADLLLIGMLLLAIARSPARIRPGLWPLLAGGILALLAVAIVATMSRIGVALLVPTLALCAALMAPPTILRDRRARAVCAAGAALLAGAVALLVRNPVVMRTLDRFDTDTDDRFMFWPSVVRAVELYFPAGSGIGSFIPVFKGVEPLTIVNRRYVVHAHSDYLEIALETGLAGIVLLTIFAVVLAIGVVRAWRQPERIGPRRRTIATTASILVILLHSLADYPLRTIALASVFAMLVANLAPPATNRRNGKMQPRGMTRSGKRLATQDHPV